MTNSWVLAAYLITYGLIGLYVWSLRARSKRSARERQDGQ